jgi:hypothetical protein
VLTTAELLLLERLSDNDLALLTEAAGEPGSRVQRIARLRERPEHIEQLLARPEVSDSLFEKSREDLLIVASPFLAFAVLLAQTPSVLRGLTFVPEWVGHRTKVPLFEVEPLREFVADPLRRLFLADLLSSYTHVASGAIWVRSRRGWRHRRFSELDPGQLAELILTVPPDQRLALYRRLGDLILFLSGVFPDHLGARTMTPIAVERLRRAVGDGGSAADGLGEPAVAGPGSLRLLESLGQRSYRLAWEATEHRGLGLAPVLGYVAEHFRHARMILNLLTDRYLFHHRERWFSLGS